MVREYQARIFVDGARKIFAYPIQAVMVMGVRWLRVLAYVFFVHGSVSGKVTQLGNPPEWSELDRFQETITKAEFMDALKSTYCPHEKWWSPWFDFRSDRVLIRKLSGVEDWYELKFSDSSDCDGFDPPKSFDSFADLLVGLDPGHIGGDWSIMERRHFQFGEDPPVKEGDLSLLVAREVSGRLSELGAKVVLLREKSEPVGRQRPDDFLEHAGRWTEEALGKEFDQSFEFELLKKQRSELLFYRVAEISARAKLVNEAIDPDVVICLHVNAAAWPVEGNRTLVERNDFHVLVNGCYMGGELAYDDQRFEMVYRLLSRWRETELELAGHLALSFAAVTKLPAFSYKGPNALKIGEVPGVWARNLLANRIYRSPVVFLEPYVANSQEAYLRIRDALQAKDDGWIKEYAEAVVAGLSSFVGKAGASTRTTELP